MTQPVCYIITSGWVIIYFIILVIRVRFTQHQFLGSEAMGYIIVTLELIGGNSARPFSVSVTPSEQSPVSAEGNNVIFIIYYWLKNVWLTGGVDFNITTLTATFDSGMTMSNVSVPVINDTIAEQHEEFDLRLDVPSSLGPAITAGSRDTATGVITDNPPSKCVSI